METERIEPPRESCLLLALAARKDKTALALLEAGADASYTDETGKGLCGNHNQ